MSKLLDNYIPPEQPSPQSEAPTQQEAIELAKKFHAVYESLSSLYGYETRKETRTLDPLSSNGRLMAATCMALLTHRDIYLPDAANRCEEAVKQRDDEAWMHAACLTIAEGHKCEETDAAVQASLATRTVFKLRKQYEELLADKARLDWLLTRESVPAGEIRARISSESTVTRQDIDSARAREERKYELEQ